MSHSSDHALDKITTDHDDDDVDQTSVKMEGLSSEDTHTKTGEVPGSCLQVSDEEDDEDSTHEDTFTVPSSQQLAFSQMSQTDEQIRMLERDGALDQIVGSQSILSQELIHSSQTCAHDDEDQHDFQLSQISESSTAMARRLGLLTQEDKETIKTEPSRVTLKQDTVDVSVSADAIDPTTSDPVVEDSPVRESEFFGSLLEAVEKITREEEHNAKMIAWQHNVQVERAVKQEVSTSTPQRGTASRRSTPKRKKVEPVESTKKSESPTKKSRKASSTRGKDHEQSRSQDIAKRAAALAEQTITDPEMAKKLLLSMALVRENPRSVPTVLPSKGATVPEGFFWAHYPPLEAVLKEHMAKYYDLSTTKCQSAQQQAFNNDLVILVRAVAKDRGWRFHPTFTDKSLRDRIRCYYKTHIQNAKKRLRTMVRNPTKRANARHLCAHLDLIEQHNHGEHSDDLTSDEDFEEETVPERKALSAKWEARTMSIDSSPSHNDEEDRELSDVTMKLELTAEV